MGDGGGPDQQVTPHVHDREVVGGVVRHLPDQAGVDRVGHHLASEIRPHALGALLHPDPADAGDVSCCCHLSASPHVAWCPSWIPTFRPRGGRWPSDPFAPTLVSVRPRAVLTTVGSSLGPDRGCSRERGREGARPSWATFGAVGGRVSDHGGKARGPLPTGRGPLTCGLLRSGADLNLRPLGYAHPSRRLRPLSWSRSTLSSPSPACSTAYLPGGHGSRTIPI